MPLFGELVQKIIMEIVEEVATHSSGHNNRNIFNTVQQLPFKLKHQQLSPFAELIIIVILDCTVLYLFFFPSVFPIEPVSFISSLIKRRIIL